MKFSPLDNSLHFTFGAALAALQVALLHPLTTFFVFAAWGLLREQAQKNERGAGLRNNWIHIWNPAKLIEGTMWGIGACLAHVVVLVLSK